MTSASGEDINGRKTCQSSSSPLDSSEATAASNASTSDQQLWLQGPAREMLSSGHSPQSEQPSPSISPAHSSDAFNVTQHSLPHSGMLDELSSSNSQPIMVPQVSHSYSRRPYQDLACRKFIIIFLLLVALHF